MLIVLTSLLVLQTSETIFVVSACGEQDVIITTSVRCMCVLPSVRQDLSGPYILHLRIDFKIIWHGCAP